MPAPASVEELLDLVQKSGVADEPKLKAYLKKLADSSGVPTDPSKLAGQLVRDGLLTYFQAEQLLQGKWKRFSLGKYKVLERLGAGGMGQVFLCEHKLMRRRVAVKVLPTAKADDPSSLGRFYREARAIAAVDHPNIVRAYDIDQDENLHFLVMEYVDGTNLQDLVRKFGPLDVTRACHYVYGAAVGLQHAHEIGLVHRDIKPGNILIDRSGVVKILDMGLARFFHDETDDLTKKYDENVLGTADYLAPEQALESHTVDIRADIYSLGATFYYLLTGSALFPEGSVAQKLIWHQSRKPQSVKSLRPEVPDELVAVLDKMMAKDPNDRYQTPADVMAALAPWVATPIPPPADREMPQLSPAAMGQAAAPTMVGRGVAQPRAAINPGPPTMSNSPTMIAPGSWPGGPAAPAGSSPTPVPAPATASPAAEANGGWNEFAFDTHAEAGDTDKPSPHDDEPAEPRSDRRPGRRAPKSGPRLAKPKPAGRGLLPLVLVGVGVLMLGGAAAGAYFLFFNKKPGPDGPGTGPSTATGPRRLTVSKTPGGELTFGTLADALSRANPGDTIVITEKVLTEGPLGSKARTKGVMVESGLPGGQPVLIEYAGPAGMPMLNVTDGEGFRLRNVELDGKASAEYGVQVSGLCPGAAFENVAVRGVKLAGFRLYNVAGQPGRPVTLDRVRVECQPKADAVVIFAAGNPDPRQVLESRQVAVRNSRFEGPGRAGVRLDGIVVDVEVSSNRFYKLDAGVVFTKVPEGRTTRAQVTGNTFYEVADGLLFDFPAPELKGKFELTATRNYFAKTPAIARWTGGGGPIPGLVSSDNGHAKDANGSNVPLVVGPVAPELPPPNPADDATFLRFPAGGPQPELGPGKVRVGVS